MKILANLQKISAWAEWTVDSATHSLAVNMHCSTGFPHSTFQHVFWENATITE
jgi:hypothetical protein